MLVIPFPVFDPATGHRKCRNLGPLYRAPSAVEGSSDLVIIACAVLLVWQACGRSAAGRWCLLLNRPRTCWEGQAWVSHAPVLLEPGVGPNVACRSVSLCFAFSQELLLFLILPFSLLNCISPRPLETKGGVLREQLNIESDFWFGDLCFTLIWPACLDGH